VAIKASSSRQIDALVTDLASADAVKREAAMARLTVLGARAVERVAMLAASTAAGPARATAFRTLEGIADPRAFEPALHAVADADQGVAIAAIAVVRLFVRSARAAAAVDRLTAVTLDRRRPEPVRLAALRALRDLEAATIAPLLKSLSADPSQAIRGAAAAPPAQRVTERDPLDALAQAADEGLPDDPDAIRLAIVQAGGIAPLPHLLKIVERVRDCEGSPPAAGAATIGRRSGRRRTSRSLNGQPARRLRPEGVARAVAYAAASRIPDGAVARRRCVLSRGDRPGAHGRA
jgi:hypothetical protein